MNTGIERLDKALDKLYKAFHNGTLDAMDCKHCAVGNLCNNSNSWIDNGSFLPPPIGAIDRICSSFENKTGYNLIELSNIEHIFVYGSKPGSPILFGNYISDYDVKSRLYTKEEQRELQFKGLCAVVEYLCELDGVKNVMDYTDIFKREFESSLN